MDVSSVNILLTIPQSNVCDCRSFHCLMCNFQDVFASASDSAALHHNLTIQHHLINVTLFIITITIFLDVVFACRGIQGQQFHSTSWHAPAVGRAVGTAMAMSRFALQRPPCSIQPSCECCCTAHHACPAMVSCHFAPLQAKQLDLKGLAKVCTSL